MVVIRDKTDYITEASTHLNDTTTYLAIPPLTFATMWICVWFRKYITIKSDNATSSTTKKKKGTVISFN